MRQLEEQQYATGKALNEEQAGLAKKEIELGRCKGEKEEVGGWTVGEEEGYGSEVCVITLTLFVHEDGGVNKSSTGSKKLRSACGCGQFGGYS